MIKNTGTTPSQARVRTAGAPVAQPPGTPAVAPAAQPPGPWRAHKAARRQLPPARTPARYQRSHTVTLPADAAQALSLIRALHDNQELRRMRPGDLAILINDCCRMRQGPGTQAADAMLNLLGQEVTRRRAQGGLDRLRPKHLALMTAGLAKAEGPGIREALDRLAGIFLEEPDLAPERGWTAQALAMMANGLGKASGETARRALSQLAQGISGRDLRTEPPWEVRHQATLANGLGKARGPAVQEVLVWLAEGLPDSGRLAKAEVWPVHALAMMANGLKGLLQNGELTDRASPDQLQAEGARDRQRRQRCAAVFQTALTRIAQAVSQRDLGAGQGWNAQHMAMVANALSKGEGAAVREALAHMARAFTRRPLETEPGWVPQNLAIMANAFGKIEEDQDAQQALAHLAQALRHRDLATETGWEPQHLGMLIGGLGRCSQPGMDVTMGRLAQMVSALELGAHKGWQPQHLGMVAQGLSRGALEAVEGALIHLARTVMTGKDWQRLLEQKWSLQDLVMMANSLSRSCSQEARQLVTELAQILCHRDLTPGRVCCPYNLGMMANALGRAYDNSASREALDWLAQAVRSWDMGPAAGWSIPALATLAHGLGRGEGPDIDLALTHIAQGLKGWNLTRAAGWGTQPLAMLAHGLSKGQGPAVLDAQARLARELRCRDLTVKKDWPGQHLAMMAHGLCRGCEDKDVQEALVQLALAVRARRVTDDQDWSLQAQVMMTSALARAEMERPELAAALCQLEQAVELRTGGLALTEKTGWKIAFLAMMFEGTAEMLHCPGLFAALAEALADRVAEDPAALVSALRSLCRCSMTAVHVQAGCRLLSALRAVRFQPRGPRQRDTLLWSATLLHYACRQLAAADPACRQACRQLAAVDPACRQACRQLAAADPACRQLAAVDPAVQDSLAGACEYLLSCPVGARDPESEPGYNDRWHTTWACGYWNRPEDSLSCDKTAGDPSPAPVSYWQQAVFDRLSQALPGHHLGQEVRVRDFPVDILIDDRVCVEVDGLSHFASTAAPADGQRAAGLVKKRRTKDQFIDHMLRRFGYQVFRIADANDPDSLSAFVARVTAAVARAPRDMTAAGCAMEPDKRASPASVPAPASFPATSPATSPAPVPAAAPASVPGPRVAIAAGPDPWPAGQAQAWSAQQRPVPPAPAESSRVELPPDADEALAVIRACCDGRRFRESSPGLLASCVNACAKRRKGPATPAADAMLDLLGQEVSARLSEGSLGELMPRDMALMIGGLGKGEGPRARQALDYLALAFLETRRRGAWRDWPSRSLAMIANGLAKSESASARAALILLAQVIRDQDLRRAADWCPQDLAMLANALSWVRGPDVQAAMVWLAQALPAVQRLRVEWQWTAQPLAMMAHALGKAWQEGLEPDPDSEEEETDRQALALDRGRYAASFEAALLRIAKAVKRRDLATEPGWTPLNLGMLANALSRHLTPDGRESLVHLARATLGQNLRTRGSCPIQSLAMLAIAFSRMSEEQAAQQALGHLAQAVMARDLEAEPDWAAHQLAMLAGGLGRGEGPDVEAALTRLARMLVSRQLTRAQGWTPLNLATTAQGLSKGPEEPVQGALTHLAQALLAGRGGHPECTRDWNAPCLALMAGGMSRGTSQEAREALILLAQAFMKRHLGSEPGWTPQNLALMANALGKAEEEEQVQQALVHLALALRGQELTVAEDWNAVALSLLANGLGRGTGPAVEQALAQMAQAVCQRDLSGWTPRVLSMLANGLSKGEGVQVQEALVHLAREIRRRNLMDDQTWSAQNLAMVAHGLCKMREDKDVREVQRQLARALRQRDLAGDPAWAVPTLAMAAYGLGRMDSEEPEIRSALVQLEQAARQRPLTAAAGWTAPALAMMMEGAGQTLRAPGFFVELAAALAGKARQAPAALVSVLRLLCRFSLKAHHIAAAACLLEALKASHFRPRGQRERGTLLWIGTLAYFVNQRQEPCDLALQERLAYLCQHALSCPVDDSQDPGEAVHDDLWHTRWAEAWWHRGPGRPVRVCQGGALQARTTVSHWQAQVFAALREALPGRNLQQEVGINDFCVDIMIDGRVCVEVDGPGHFVPVADGACAPCDCRLERRSKDLFVDQMLRQYGYRVFRITDAQNPESLQVLIRQVRGALGVPTTGAGLGRRRCPPPRRHDRVCDNAHFLDRSRRAEIEDKGFPGRESGPWQAAGSAS